MTIKEFMKYWEAFAETASDEELETMYSKKWKIELDDKVVEIPFDATSYNAILEALTVIEDENNG